MSRRALSCANPHRARAIPNLDSHPPLARRLARIEELPAGHPFTWIDEPLLADRASLPRVQRKILGEVSGQATAPPWADVAAEAFAVEQADRLLEAARDVGMTAHPTLDTVLDLLGQGRQLDLARLTGDAEPKRHLAEALRALVGQALACAGQARWAFGWTKGYLLVPHVETGRDLEELVAADWSQAGADELRADQVRRGLRQSSPRSSPRRSIGGAWCATSRWACWCSSWRSGESRCLVPRPRSVWACRGDHGDR